VRRALQLLLLALALSASIGVRAQNCAGFTDYPAAGQFCPNVEWLKNRGVTLGCTATAYCPDDPVIRLSMAAFMNRLGRALAVEPLFVEATTGPITLGAGPPQIVCVTADTASTNYPRAATVIATVSGLADANSVAWRAAVYFSTDAGATWQPTTVNGGMRASSPANWWTNGAFETRLNLDPSTTYRFAVGVLRDDIMAGSTGNLADGRCQVTAAVVNRNGTVPPLDGALAARSGSAP
jgi:hypothetical protein